MSSGDVSSVTLEQRVDLGMMLLRQILLMEGIPLDRWKTLMAERYTLSDVLEEFIFSDGRKVLVSLGTTFIPASNEKFIAKDKFVVTQDSPVKIAHVWKNFQEWFFDGGGKIEEVSGEQVIRRHKLSRCSRDTPILRELGGKERVAVGLAEIYQLIARQPNGESGVLTTDAYANIFYVKDCADRLVAVAVDWRTAGWNVGAFQLDSPEPWCGENNVFSRLCH